MLLLFLALAVDIQVFTYDYSLNRSDAFSALF